MRDSYKKAALLRAQQSQKLPQEKLTKVQIQEIQKELIAGHSLREIAKKYGVSHQLIFNIKHGNIAKRRQK